MTRGLAQLGRYELLVQLGRGGMAEVYAGRLHGEGGFAKLVAIKRMLPHLRARDELVQRFLEEARLAALVESAHVVSTLDVGRDEEGGPFIVLELVVGVTLARLLSAAGARLSIRDRVELVAQAARGLAAVHGTLGPNGEPLGMVHRDVSPQNVLVDVDGCARLADFGIARADVSRARTATGVVLGKVGYMAPEQVRGGAVDARADVFALGVVLYEALALRRLHPNADARPSEVAAMLADGRIPPIRWSAPDVPEALAEVVDRALRVEPEERYADAARMAAAIAAATSGAPSTELAAAVREAGGDELARLEETLRDARTADQDSSTRTLSIVFADATVSGVIGGAWDPSAPTAPLPPPELTEVDGDSTEVAPTEVASTRVRRSRSPLLGLIALGAVTLVVGAGLTALLFGTPSATDRELAPAARSADPTPSTIPAPALDGTSPLPSPDTASPETASPERSPPPTDPPSARTDLPRPSTPSPGTPRDRSSLRVAPASSPEPASEPAPAPNIGARGGFVGLDRFDEEAQ